MLFSMWHSFINAQKWRWLVRSKNGHWCIGYKAGNRHNDYFQPYTEAVACKTNQPP